MEINKSQSEFNPYRCGSCGDTKKLKLCSGCCLISFCSSACQSRYWSKHRPFCLVIGDLLKKYKKSTVFKIFEEGFTGFGPAKRLMKAIDFLYRTLKRLLERDLTPEEHKLIFYPKYCEVCYETDSNKLTKCSECLFSSYCKTGDCKHQLETNPEIHQKYCLQYKIAFLCYRDCQYEKVFEHVPSKTDYGDFVTQNSPNYDLLTLVEDVSGKKFIKFPSNRQEMISFVTVCQFTFTATIIDALFKANLLQSDRESLCIDIVGASIVEDTYFHEDTCSIFYSFMPKLHSIKINLIGPEINITHVTDVNCYGKTVKIGYYKNFYEDFQSNGPEPDMIICFNCGFSEECWTDPNQKDTDWVRGIKKILSKKVPFAFTCYTKSELNDDMSLVKRVIDKMDLGGNVTSIFYGNNSFKDMRPMQNFDKTFNEPIYYGNQKLCVMNWKESLTEEEFDELNCRFLSQVKL